MLTVQQFNKVTTSDNYYIKTEHFVAKDHLKIDEYDFCLPRLN